MSLRADGKPLVFVADAHLTGGDPEVDSFIAFLDQVAPAAGTLTILGDLFNIWFGEPRFRMPHQSRVLEALDRLRERGVTLKFIEGNRDFSIRRCHLGAPFDDVSAGRLIETHCGRRILAAHGDEVNRDDRQYLLWKRFSKSPLVYGLFRLLPGRWGIRIGERLERRLSGTNLRHKITFPHDECVSYARSVIPSICDVIVLGHFHEERSFEVSGGMVHVVPTWRGHHRYLVFEGGEPGRFVTFRPGQETLC